MAYPASPYIDERYEGLYIAGTGVSLDSVLINFRQGASPRTIVEAFPTVTLSQVYGAIAYYLNSEETINAYLAEGERAFESAPRLSQTNRELFARLNAARRRFPPEKA
jgi:uncharacterized protein (DUF433 family)